MLVRRLAWCRCQSGQARLWGAAEQLRAALGCRPAPATRATYERAVAKVRAQLPEETFMVAWAEGQAMNLEQAVTYALQES